MDDKTRELIARVKNIRIQRGPDGPFSAPLAQKFPDLAGFCDDSQENKFDLVVGTRSVSDPTVRYRFRDDEDICLSATLGQQKTRMASHSGEVTGELSTSASEADMKLSFRNNTLQPPPIGSEREAMKSGRLEKPKKVVSCSTPKPLPIIRVQSPTPRRSTLLATSKQFYPMPRDCEGEKKKETPEMMAYRVSHGFSANYQGNLFVERNKSAPISDKENCSVFITGLPVNITIRRLLEHISNHGRIYATHINSPDLARGHTHCAAKVVFFEALSAQKFLLHCNTYGLTINRHVVRAVHNRIRCAEINASHMASRVLLIYGPADIVNPKYLTAFFSELFTFEVDCIIGHGAARHTPEKALVEYRFGSFRCQSQLAKKALCTTYDGIVDVFYGEDPCSLPHTVIPNGHFLWTLFWCSQIEARAFMADVAKQQTSAATLASQARCMDASQKWTLSNRPIMMLE